VPRFPFVIAAVALLATLVAAPAVAAPATTDRLAQRKGKVWLLRSALTNGVATSRFAFGLEGDVPVMGDWNGDGTGTVGVFRAGRWFQRDGNGPGPARTFRFGVAGDVPVAGDWNGDGRDTVGVFRNGTWFLRDGNGPGPSTGITFGTAPGADALAWSIPRPSRGRAGCSAAYPTVCIPPAPPDLDCPDVLPRKRFKVLAPDPHRFDGDNDGIGCE
jgi:hypothetical protein